MEVPYAKGKRRNASAREVAFAKQKQQQKMKPLHSKNSTAGSSQPPKPNVAQPSSQLQAAGSSSSTTPAVGGATTTTGATSAPSRPDITIRQAGLWTRFWLLICFFEPFFCTSPHTPSSPITACTFRTLLDCFNVQTFLQTIVGSKWFDKVKVFRDTETDFTP
ncbi:hypothetical protein BDR05DRAFT_951524 [Suillus weaverae]|nr:hypothetical protein BDR05DRAFT_951524 [Suillus weaverae]